MNCSSDGARVNPSACSPAPSTNHRSIYTSRWKVIPRELCKKLRTRRPIRKNKRHSVKDNGGHRSPMPGRSRTAPSTPTTAAPSDISKAIG